MRHGGAADVDFLQRRRSGERGEIKRARRACQVDGLQLRQAGERLQPRELAARQLHGRQLRTRREERDVAEGALVEPLRADVPGAEEREVLRRRHRGEVRDRLREDVQFLDLGHVRHPRERGHLRESAVEHLHLLEVAERLVARLARLHGVEPDFVELGHGREGREVREARAVEADVRHVRQRSDGREVGDRGIGEIELFKRGERREGREVRQRHVLEREPRQVLHGRERGEGCDLRLVHDHLARFRERGERGHERVVVHLAEHERQPFGAAFL